MLRRPLTRALMIALAALTWPLAAAAQQWHEYKPDAAGYRIDMPGTPAARSQETKTAAGTASYHSATVVVEQRSFMASHVVYPAGAAPTDPQKEFDRLREGQRRSGLVVRTGEPELGMVRDEKRFTLDGAPAIRLVIEKGDSIMSILAVLKANILYQMIYVGPADSKTSPDIERFMASFALVKS
ncbi:hypothetical protein [Reyranella sp. CPCC 100927]|uniref:hypothetical protein n=1 Tax=Reyranella sp. CPCC 100927 TaxID=2599616 RepID=UPI0011B3A890|nr:hypothetical protein [Reyranella sp. CPCC 100927]TWT01164.1 hypothetical protein FQU96_32270 [Reyranella sp. CPCC 100927]